MTGLQNGGAIGSIMVKSNVITTLTELTGNVVSAGDGRMFNEYDGFPSDEFFAVLLDSMANSSYDMVAYLLGDGQ